MFRKFILFSIFCFAYTVEAFACGSCTIPRLGKDTAVTRAESKNKKFYFEYIFEQKNYDVMDAQAAHELHDDGYHFHDKTTEDLHHYKIGGFAGESLELFAEIPYVIRRSLEVDSHAILGSKQTSEGWGDLNVIGSFKFWQKDTRSFNAVAGVKFPTGSIKEKNSIGTVFEAELQPGSGSYDYILGGIYRLGTGRSSFVANMSWLARTEGRHEFEYGDVFVTTLYCDYFLNPGMKNFAIRAGLDMVYQNEQKQKDHGAKVGDSGGQTILLGPVLKVNTGEHISIVATLLYPVMQNLGGVHQELDYEWTLGGRVGF